MKYGVSKASRKYDKARSYIYFWLNRYDGTLNHWHASHEDLTDIQKLTLRKNSSLFVMFGAGILSWV
jgi:hypothetical protein